MSLVTREEKWHILGGWWETCSATKRTLLAEDQGTGPSDTVSWRKVGEVQVRQERRKNLWHIIKGSWGGTEVSLGEGPTPRLRLAGPSGSRRLLPGWGCKVSWPLSLSSPRGKPTGTTSPLAPCAPGAPAAQQCWWESHKQEFSVRKLKGEVWE